MERRLIFPVIMFSMAGVSFAFGVWQYVYAQRVASNSAQRTAFIVQTIERSGVSANKKQEMYASIFRGLPKAPTLLGIDVSGSFASQGDQDQCDNEGQRSVCRALIEAGTTAAALTAICGQCNPK